MHTITQDIYGDYDEGLYDWETIADELVEKFMKETGRKVIITIVEE